MRPPTEYGPSLVVCADGTKIKATAVHVLDGGLIAVERDDEGQMTRWLLSPAAVRKVREDQT